MPETPVTNGKPTSMLELSLDSSPVFSLSSRIVNKLKWWHILVLFSLLTLYWLAPTFRDLSGKEIVSVGGKELESAEKAVSGKHGSVPNPTELDITLNFLVRVSVNIWVDYNGQGETYVSRVESRQAPSVRTENVILLWGLCFGTMIALASAKPAGRTPIAERATPKVSPAPGETPEKRKEQTAEQALSDDVAAAANPGS
jgi:hypothetical protein